jgi:hypothetical protein
MIISLLYRMTIPCVFANLFVASNCISLMLLLEAKLEGIKSCCTEFDKGNTRISALLSLT